jgi:hypothetical protein
VNAMAPQNEKRPVPALAENEPRKADRLAGTISSPNSTDPDSSVSFAGSAPRRGAQGDPQALGGSVRGRSMKPHHVATINTGHCCQVRLQLSTWHEQTKIELKPYSATIPQVYMPCGPGVSIDVTKADELIEAIRTATALHIDQSSEGN